MNTREVDPEIGKRYLLGGLDPETEALDERLLLGDPGLANQLGVFEDELVDAFVRGELPAGQAERFERHFLRPAARQQKVVFAERLHRYIARYQEARDPRLQAAAAAPPAKRRLRETLDSLRDWLDDRLRWSPTPAWSYALAGLLVVAILGGFWALTGRLQLQNRVTQLEAQIAQLEGDGVATVWLAPGLLRGAGEVERLLLSPNTSLVRLQLDIGIDDYAHYRVTLIDANGDELWSQSRLAATSTEDRVSVDLTLPAEILPRGDYSIRLSGVTASGDSELVGRYYFRVLEE